MPGSIHLDLLRAGAIVDPHLGDNESLVQWVDLAEWEYTATLELPGPFFDRENVALVFEQIDTFATVELNGKVLGAVANMHHPQRFDVRGVVQRRNVLGVRFRSAVREVKKEEARLGTLPWLNTPAPFNFARKSAYHFGWDWAPTLVGCGLGRVFVEAWNGPRIAYVRPLVVRASEEGAHLEVHVDIEGAADVRVELSIRGSPVARAEGEGPIALTIPKPALWWPRGHGAQPLYDLVAIAGEDRTVQRTGIRTAALDTRGGAFTLQINGKPIYCKGANFVPEDSFYTRATSPERYQARLAQACDANMNTLRVWGGGFYETDAFYDRCDEAGLLVWQDFLFACACYPEEEPHWSRVEAEARHQIARLARHPSLVLWNGCNENLWGYFDWGWVEPTRGRSWGRGYYFDLFPRLCRELDSSRPYWPGSPYSGAFDPPNPPHPNDPATGNRHVWDMWSGAGHPVIGKQAPRFVSEFGFQGPPSFALLECAMTAEGSPLLQHQKSERAEEAARNLVRALFGEPESIDREHHLRQVAQARAVGSLIEWFRVLWPTNAGAIFWQLNDAWPAISWSAIDHAGRKKPLYYAVRRAFADELLTFQPSSPGSDDLALHWVNDTDAAADAPVAIDRVRFDGTLLARRTIRARPAPRSVARVVVVEQELAPRDPTAELLVARTGALRANRFFRPDKELSLPPARVHGALVGDILRLQAETLVRDAVLHIDRLDPSADLSDQLLTLLPGEVVELRVFSERPIDVRRLLSFPVFQSSAASSL